MNAHDATGRPAGLLRRLGAVLYDGLLLFSVLYFATLVVVLAFKQGQAIEPNNPWYTAYLLAVSFAYFGWFWTHGGQTLGLRAWRLRAESRTGGPVSWRQAALRFACSLLSWGAFGIGFLWVWADPARLAWHDRLSGTRLVLTPPAC